jgi:uncharacterized membrane protein
MTQPQTAVEAPPKDAQLERVLAFVLMAGVGLSAVLVLAGLTASFVVGWTGSLLGQPMLELATTDFSALLERLAGLQPLALAQLGLLVLIATPVFRVGVSIVGFAREGDRLYVALAGIVLALLALSLVALR